MGGDGGMLGACTKGGCEGPRCFRIQGVVASGLRVRNVKVLQAFAWMGAVGTFPAMPVLGGPPLVIDDPGILDPGQLEIIVASTGEARGDDSTVHSVPVLDVSLGLTANTQMSVVVPYVFGDPGDGADRDGLGNLGIGAKWRFLATDRVQVAFAPGYSRGVSARDAEAGLGAESDSVYMPVDVEMGTGPWTLNAELGYTANESAANQWAYGAALSRTVRGRWKLMAELYGSSANDGRHDRLAFQLGCDLTVGARWHVLAALGTGLREASEEPDLDYSWYLGIQHFH